MIKTKIGLVAKSSNKKTGPIPVSTSTPDSCPNSCPLKNKGCYAKYGPLSLHWKKLSEKSIAVSVREFCNLIKELPEGQLWRHNQAGDLIGHRERVNATAARAIAYANIGRCGFTYTHYPVENHRFAKHNREVLSELNSLGFTVNLSTETLEQADRYFSLGIAPVTTLLPEGQSKTVRTKSGVRVLVCPATKRDDVTCATCSLCADSKRNYIIGFPVHGTAKRYAESLTKEK